MGCLFRLFRLLIVAAIVIVAIALLLPKFLAQAGNTVLNNVNSTISGVAQLIPANLLDKTNKLQISLNGLDNNKHYEVTLDPGGCGNSGSVDVGLVTSDSSGSVNTTFSLSSLKDSSQGWSVDVHSGPSSSDSTLACSQLTTNGTSVVADATNTVLQLSPVATNTDFSNTTSPDTTSPTSTPKGLPNTGVAPGSNNSYDNNVYPRKF